MDRASQRAATKAALLEILAPKQQSRFVTGLNAFYLLLGLGIALGVGMQEGKHHFVLVGCGVMLMAEGRLLRVFSGIAALALDFSGMLLMLGGLTLSDVTPWSFYVFGGALLVMCVLLPFAIWRWRQALKS